MFTDWNDYQQEELKSLNFSPPMSDYNEVLRQSLLRNALSGNPPDLPVIHTLALNGWFPGARFYWQGSDSEERYQTNVGDPVNRLLLEQYGWLDKEVVYEVNSWGFRSRDQKEFDQLAGPTLITMGCSFTFGTALNQEQIWPQLLADKLGMDLANIAVPGLDLGPAVQWLLCNGDQIANPAAIVVQKPPTGRVTWPKVDRGAAFIDSLINFYDDNRYADIVSNQRLLALSNYITHYHTIKLWAEFKNIPLVFFSGMGVLNMKQRGLARDLMHYGTQWHQFEAERSYNQIKRLTRI